MSPGSEERLDFLAGGNMKHPIARLAIIVSAALAIIGFGTGFEAAEPDEEVTYEVRPLSTLGGTSSRGNGVNDAGLVTGFSNLTENKTRRASVWFHDQVFQLDPLGGTNSSVAWSGKNNSGLVVGITQTSQLQARTDGWSCRIFFPGPDNAKYTCVGFVWEGGRMTALPTLGGDNGFATSANNQRQVVGWAETTIPDTTCTDPSQPGFRAVLWNLSRKETVALPPYANDSAGAATAISDRGQVVGISGDCDQSVGRRTARHAVLWENGTVKNLGNVGADTWNTPTAITRQGDIVVGFGNAPGADPDAPAFRAWLWTERDDIACVKLPGTDICDLGTLDPGGTAEAWGVNERGQVVGTSCSPSGDCRAFLWENGEMKDLDLLKGTYPHRLFNAMDINNLGQITGRAQTSSGFEAFIATPNR
jgi:probable HAF family extracellular repeat protein